MRIAHFYGHRTPNGVMYAMLDAARLLTERGHEVQLLCRRASPLTAFPHHLTYHRPFALTGTLIRAQLLLALRRLRPDVLNVHSELDAEIAMQAAAKLGIPVCYTCHELSDVACALAPRAVRVIAVSAGVGRFLADRYGIRPPVLHVIPNGVDASLLPREDRRTLRKACRFADDELWIGFLGRVTVAKNAEGLVRAVAAVAHRAPALRLIVMGNGNRLAATQAQVHAASLTDRVRFTGWLPRADALRIVGALDALALPSSEAEGLSNSLLYAMGLGVPVLATDLPSLADGPLRDGETGWSCGTDDAGLADGLLRVVDGDRLHIGARARAEIATQYRLDQVIDRFEIACHETIAAHAASPAARQNVL